MMSDDITQCLFSAVESWEMMREKASASNLPVSVTIYVEQAGIVILHMSR